jgi:transposase-like protein
LSDRDIESLAREAGLGTISRTTVSTICRELRDRYRAFRARSLAEVRLLALFTDAIYLPVRPEGPKEGVLAKVPDRADLHARVRAAYWAALDETTTPAEAETGLRALVGSLAREYPSAAAGLADDLPALTVHLAHPLRLRRRLRSTNLLERSLEEVRRRTKVIGRFSGETSCLTMAWAVMDLVIAGAHGLELTLPERHAIAAKVAAGATPRTVQQVA